MSCKRCHKSLPNDVKVDPNTESCLKMYFKDDAGLKRSHSANCILLNTFWSKDKTSYHFRSISFESISVYTSEGQSAISKHFSKELLNVREGIIGDGVSDSDLLEIGNTLINLESTSCKNSKRNLKAIGLENKGLNTLPDVHDISYSGNIPSTQHEEVNTVECLLDLDDYLEKMEKNCFIEAIADLNLKEPTTAVANSNSSFVQSKNSKTNFHFDRNLKLRNTIGSIFHKRDKTNEFTAASIYGTWNKHNVNGSYPQQQKKSTTIMPTNCDVGREVPQCSINNNKSEFLQNTNALEMECGNKNCLQVLTNDHIFRNLIEQNQNIESNGPRQYGRRLERLNPGNFEHLSYANSEPIHAPTLTSTAESYPIDSGVLGWDENTTRNSYNREPDSIEPSLNPGESLVTLDNINELNNSVNEESNHQNDQSMYPEIINASIKCGFDTYWPHNHSRTLALISCTLGLFNISRFAILTINFGGNFLIQFFILSIIFGIPFLWLQMCLGAKIKAGPISMWKISPICVGIGVSITLAQYFIAIYSSVAVVWLFIYIQDIFLNKSSYPWAVSINPIVDRPSSYIHTNLSESIPNYLNINVLQRIQIIKTNSEDRVWLHVNDRLAFYMTLLWTVVFLILCKGLKSFGKLILFLGTLPIILLAAVTLKLLYVVEIAKLQNIFNSFKLNEFLVNPQPWVAAAQETFLTWGLFGASIIAISSREHIKPCKLALRKDAILVVLVTLIGLCLSALIGLCSIQILNESGYVYIPGSFETSKSYSAIFHVKSIARNDLISYPTKLMPHYSTLVGEVYRRNTDTMNVSGYQVLRFVTELLPAVVAITTEKLSWIWTLILFIAFLLFGLSQLCVMWKPICCVLGNSSSAVLITCVSGLLLSIPFVTEIGVTLLYYMDILLGGAWLIPVLWSAEIFGIFLIRGRPYNSDDLVNDLKMSGFISGFLALSWNILLPIGLIILAISEYKISMSNQWYYWRGKSYFSYWSRKAGAITQIGFLILIPILAVIQVYRYLTSGSPDILDRIQKLYRPLEDVEDIRTNDRTNRNLMSRHDDPNRSSTSERFQDDDPPKYTPPPSYTTATGARLAKILRQSFRRSIRRILRESDQNRLILHSSIQPELQSEQASCPALTAEESNISISESIEFENRPQMNLLYGQSLSLGRKQILNKRHLKQTDEHLSLSCVNHSNFNRHGRLSGQPYTAKNVRKILRSSTLGRDRLSRSIHLQNELTFRSIENLVENAEALNLSLENICDYSNRND